MGRVTRDVLRPSEAVIVLFFLYATAMAPGAGTLFLNAGILAVLALAAARAWNAFRDWYALALIPIAYWQMGWVHRPSLQHLERAWVNFDRALLNDWGLRAVIESLGPLIPMLLELSYSVVYVIPPVGLGLIYYFGRRAHAERFLFPVLLATLVCYALYPWFPVYPPRFAFPGTDVPSYQTPFRAFNWLFLSNYAANTNVFPSGHVTAAIAAAAALMRVLRDRPSVGSGMMILAALIALSTVYGRYHYAVDAIAGAALAVAVHVISGVWERSAGLAAARAPLPSGGE